MMKNSRKRKPSEKVLKLAATMLTSAMVIVGASSCSPTPESFTHLQTILSADTQTSVDNITYLLLENVGDHYYAGVQFQEVKLVSLDKASIVNHLSVYEISEEEYRDYLKTRYKVQGMTITKNQDSIDFMTNIVNLYNPIATIELENAFQADLKEHVQTILNNQVEK